MFKQIKMEKIPPKRKKYFESKIQTLIINENISIKKIFNINDNDKISQNLYNQLKEYFSNVDEAINNKENEIMHVDKIIKFGKEINKFTNHLIAESNKMNKLRFETISILENIVQSNIKGFKVDVYGSFLQGLSLKSSDIDFSLYCYNKSLVNSFSNLLNDKKDINDLKKLRNILVQNSFSQNIKIIECKYFSILRGTCSKTKIDFDISIDNELGVMAGYEIKDIIEKHPIFKPLILFIKSFLKLYNYDCTYKGGISSFLLFNLVYIFYIYKKKDLDIHILHKEQSEQLGYLFLHFLEFYKDFKHKIYGIILDNDGTIEIIKKSNLFVDIPKYQIFIWTYLDKFKSMLGEKSYKYNQVKSLFTFLYEKIYELIKKDNDVDILGSFGFGFNY